MITLLRKIFIKDYKNLSSPKVREQHGLLASIGGIVINFILFGIKLIIGILSFSLSIISDAINNLTDMFSCIINLLGFKIASKPADEDHPYGHERVEYIAGMAVSFVILAVAIMLLYTSISKLIKHEHDVTIDMISFIILGVAIVGKVLLGLYNFFIGKLINSVSLKAAMQDSINDAICTTGVLISSIVMFFVPSLWYIDPIVSIIISLFIFYSGIKMIKETSDPLIGINPNHQFVKDILSDIRKHEIVLGIHDLVFHSYGPSNMFMTVHVEVDGYIDMISTHDTIDNIEVEIKEKYGVNLTIHMDPIDTKNKEIPLIKEHIHNFLKELNEDLSFHDLRIVYGPTHTNVLFDIAICHKTKIKKEEILSFLLNKFKQLDEKYRLVVSFDDSYISLDEPKN